jgi:hypothetical protein
MNRKLDSEERAREEAEEACGEKLLELDALKCVAPAAHAHTRKRAPTTLYARACVACVSDARLSAPRPPRRSEKEEVVQSAAMREAALLATAAARESELVSTAAAREAALQHTVSEREADAAAADEAARVLAAEADCASKALFCVSQSILRWREELVVASLEPENYGHIPSAQQVLDVVADMENEIEVNVVMADALPTELKSKLLAKRAEQTRRKRLEAPLGEGWAFGVRGAMDAPERLARLVNAGAASTSAPAAPAARRVQHSSGGPSSFFARVRTPPKRGKENDGTTAPAFAPAPAAASSSDAAPPPKPLQSAASLQNSATERAAVAKALSGGVKPAASPLRAGFDPLLPGELPGGLEAAVAAPMAPQSSLKFRVVPKARKGTYGNRRAAGDRRAAVAAVAAAFDDEPAGAQQMQRGIALVR